MTLINSTKLTVVIGLGVTGLSCVRYLVKQQQPVAVIDTRAAPPGLAELCRDYPQVSYKLGGFDADLLAQAGELVVSPGLSLQHPALADAVARGVSVVGDIELFARAVNKPVIAITGSNGKSTVTQLVGDMVAASGYKVAVCGNIGTPVLDCLESAVDFYVMELSSFQLETTYSLNPAAAVLLNLSADHMDRYATLEQYLQAKQRIFLGCQQAVVNADEPETWQSLTCLSSPFTFSLESPAADFYLGSQQGADCLMYRQEPLIAVKGLPYPERHNLQNALAALALGHAVGLPFDRMLLGLQQFHSLAHRCQLIGQYAGVKWYNDSKATNVGAALAAIASLGRSTGGQLILIAGGNAKGADLYPLAAPARQFVKHAILLGKDAPLLAETLQHACALTRVNNLTEAVQLAAALAEPQDIVLLSPACSSLDQFKNFEERGKIFTEAVQALVFPSPAKWDREQG